MVSNLFAWDTGYISIIVAGSLIVIIILLHLFRKHILKKISKRTHFNRNELSHLETPLILIASVLALEIVVTKIINVYLNVDIQILNITRTLLIIFLTYLLTIVASIILDKWSKRVKHSAREATHEEILPLAKSATNIILVLAATLMILETWGVQIGGLVASLGIAGLILSFAFKDTLANIFGGISMMMDNSFSKGDLIELLDGEVGYVMEINLRSTKIKNFDSQEVLVPNGLLANSKIKNYAKPSRVTRIKIAASIAYGSDVDKFKKIINELVAKQKYVLRYPKQDILFLKMSDYSLDFSILFFINNFNNLYSIKSEMTEKIYKELGKNNITIPFPTRTIYAETKSKKQK